MPTQALLEASDEVDNEDIDDIIAMAFELEQESLPIYKRTKVKNFKKIAAELEIDPKFVQLAIAKLTEKREREQELTRQAKAAHQKEIVRRKLSFWTGVASLALAGMVALSMLGSSLSQAVERISASVAQINTSEVYLLTALDRQVALTPQLAALAQGDVELLSHLALQYQRTQKLNKKLAIANDLSLALAKVLSELPAPTNEPEDQRRLALVHELSGVRSRVDTEQRRYRMAIANYREAEQKTSSKLALQMGLVEGYR